MAERILIIDDDDRLAEMLAQYLTARGHSVTCRADGESGLAEACSGRHDALVLDVMLPDFDGFELCRRLRRTSELPVLMLTARGDELDRIIGLEIGADDYLPKPFNPRELLARLTAILRRTRRSSSPETALHFGRLTIDPTARLVVVDDRACELTSHQFDLLYVLASRSGRVQSRNRLMEAVRGQELEAFDRSIDVHISRIRAAIEVDPGSPRYIITVRGVGYVFAVPDEVG